MLPRTHERKYIFTEIELQSASGKRGARITDVSFGGCFVDTIVTARVGEKLVLKLDPDSERPVRLSGRVAYVLDGFGFGIEFDELMEESRSDLAKFLEDVSA